MWTEIHIKLQQVLSYTSYADHSHLSGTPIEKAHTKHTFKKDYEPILFYCTFLKSISESWKNQNATVPNFQNYFSKTSYSQGVWQKLLLGQPTIKKNAEAPNSTFAAAIVFHFLTPNRSYGLQKNRFNLECPPDMVPMRQEGSSSSVFKNLNQ